uniref:Uncharacterized protein n=1 Tax=Chelonoidis abingdonii TaxID=106734 RepID=A0A8C0H2X9_CHEAB
MILCLISTAVLCNGGGGSESFSFRLPKRSGSARSRQSQSGRHCCNIASPRPSLYLYIWTTPSLLFRLHSGNCIHSWMVSHPTPDPLLQ